MTNNQTFPKDLETLSAFLDGQLNSKQLARLEARLDKETDLLVALKELRHTRDALRASPQVRAPRNFMLTPEMVGVKQKRNLSLFSTFRLASTLASILFVVAVIGDFTGRGGVAVNLSSMPETESYDSVQEKEVQPMLEMASDVESVDAMPVEAFDQVSQPEAFAVEPNTAIDDAEARSGEAASIIEGSVPIEENLGGLPEVEQPMMAAAPPVEEAHQSVQDDCWVMADGATGKSGVSAECAEANQDLADEETLIQDVGETEITDQESKREIQELSRPWTLFRKLELMFGVFAVLFGGIAWILHRRKIS